MKNITAVFSFLVIAIICLGLVSCANQEPLAEPTSAPTESTTQPATEEPGTTVTTTLPETTAIQVTENTTTAKTTLPQTTTTKPVITTQAQTTVPATTQAATETTQPTTVSTTIATQTVTPPIITDGEDCDTVVREVVDLINKERIAKELEPLTISAELCKAADIRAKEISKDFSHVRPDGTLCFTVSELVKAENIATGQRDAQSVVNAWMNSDGHKKNILSNQATITGVGCYYNAETDTYFWVQVFG